MYHSGVNPAMYLAVSFFAVGWWSLASVGRLPERFGRVPIGQAFLILAALALAVTAVEVLGLWRPPGSQELRYLGLVRPAGITGAMQHHAIMMAALFFVLWEYGRWTGHWLYRAVAIAAAVASVTSLTRSGAMVLGVGLAALACERAVPVLRSLSVTRLRRDVPAVVSLVAVGWLFWNGFVRDEPVTVAAHAERVLSSFDLASVGNSARVESWGEGMREIVEGPFVVGHRTGAVTNVTSRLGAGSSYVVESGILQQILNYGLVGCLLFYLVMALTVRAVPRPFAWLRAGGIALIVNSFVYQTVEVFPVIVMLGLLPWLGDGLAHTLNRHGMHATRS
jgi:hypothetical protein